MMPVFLPVWYDMSQQKVNECKGCGFIRFGLMNTFLRLGWVYEMSMIGLFLFMSSISQEFSWREGYCQYLYVDLCCASWVFPSFFSDSWTSLSVFPLWYCFKRRRVMYFDFHFCTVILSISWLSSFWLSVFVYSSAVLRLSPVILTHAPS